MNLTRRQRQILDFVTAFIERKRYAPSIEEICKHFSLRSPATVHKHLKNLEERGALRRDWNRGRSIEVFPEQASDHTLKVAVEGTVGTDRVVRLVRSKQRIAVSADMLKGGRGFALRVEGDGLRSEHVRDGDLLLLLEMPEPPDGGCVLASVRGEESAGFYRLVRKDNRLRMTPLDARAKSLLLNPQVVHIHGVLSGLVRRY